MKAHEIHAMSTGEIRSHLHSAREEFFNLRFQFTVGQLENFNRLSEIKRDIARLETVLRQRELAGIK
jgi:large subunit ribosomal protein L29